MRLIINPTAVATTLKGTLLRINLPEPSVLKGSILDEILKKASVNTSDCILSPNLIGRTTLEQQNLLKKMFGYYQNISQNTIIHPVDSLIQKNSLLHGTKFEPTKIDEILGLGLISPDIAKKGKIFRVSNGEQQTIGGIDTWVCDENRSIDEYFNKWLATPPEYVSPFFIKNRQMMWRGENKWIDLGQGGKSQNSVVFIINPNKHPELDLFVKNSVTPQTCNLSDKIFAGDMTNRMYKTKNYERHTFVPVGIPSNYFEKIIIGDWLDSANIATLKELLKKHNLSVKIYNTKGELL